LAPEGAIRREKKAQAGAKKAENHRLSALITGFKEPQISPQTTTVSLQSLLAPNLGCLKFCKV